MSRSNARRREALQRWLLGEGIIPRCSPRAEAGLRSQRPAAGNHWPEKYRPSRMPEPGLHGSMRARCCCWQVMRNRRMMPLASTTPRFACWTPWAQTVIADKAGCRGAGEVPPTTRTAAKAQMRQYRCLVSAGGARRGRGDCDERPAVASPSRSTYICCGWSRNTQTGRAYQRP